MPLKRLPEYKGSRMDELRARLAEEWLTPRKDVPEPMIIEEGCNTLSPGKVTVVWSEWRELSLEERSEIIIDAFYDAFSKAAGFTIPHTALGLTPDEADRMHIDYRQSA